MYDTTFFEQKSIASTTSFLPNLSNKNNLSSHEIHYLYPTSLTSLGDAASKQ
jgi:hypothetical protein